MRRLAIILFGLFLLVAASTVSADSPVPSAVPGKHSELIESIALQYGFNPRFVQALIWRESRFNAAAHGSHGEIGLMQLKMSVVRDWAKAHKRSVPAAESVYDMELNLHIGLWRLDQAMKHWEGYEEQVSLALFEYNAGRTSILRRLAHCGGDVSLLLRSYSSGDYAADILEKYAEFSRLDVPKHELAQN